MIPALLADAGSVGSTASATPHVLAVVLAATLNPSRAAVFTSPAFKAGAATTATSKSVKKAAKAKPAKQAKKKPVKRTRRR